MLAKTRGIVLNQIKYSETSIIVYMYTENFGRQTYLIKGAKRKNSKLKANIFQPLFLLDLEVYHKPNRNFQNIKEAKINTICHSVSSNIIKNSISLFIAEVLYKLIKEEEANKPMFNFLYNSIIQLDLLESDYINFHLFFLIELTQFIGFLPHNNYSQNSYFDMLRGQFSKEKPSHNHYFNQTLSVLLNYLLTGNKANFSIPSINNVFRIQLLEKMIEFYQVHQEGFSNIKSLEVFKEIFR